MMKITSSFAAKSTAVVLLFVFCLATVLSGVGIGVMVGSDAYADGGVGLKENALFQMVMRDARSVEEAYLLSRRNADYDPAELAGDVFPEDSSNFWYRLTGDDGTELANYTPNASAYTDSRDEVRSMDSDTAVKEIVRSFETEAAMGAFVEEFAREHSIEDMQESDPVEEGESAPSYSVVIHYRDLTPVRYHIDCGVDASFSAQDKYRAMNELLDWMVGARYAIIVICAVSAVLTAAVFLFLLSAAGHKSGVEGIHLNWVDRIPFDLYLAALTLLSVFLLRFVIDGGDYRSTAFRIIQFSFISFYFFAAVVGALLTFAARAKAGNWWQNTVVFRGGRAVLRILGRLAKGLVRLISLIPMTWKAVLVFAALTFAELIGMGLIDSHLGAILFLWMIEKILQLMLVIVVVSSMRRLEKAGQAIADGRTDCEIDTRMMPAAFRRHAENISDIQAGLRRAVDEGVRSERMKAELITNVSHDIKTPLTSIVNYVDLLKKEDVQPDKAKEYIDVLDRQSERLKKLTEDLVEASKASTGNLAVNFDSTDVNVLLGQTAAEYAEKIEKAGLELVLTLAPETPAVRADGRLLWRVFGNLLSNVCKYSLAGTRVYVTSRVVGTDVEMSFRNISSNPLNISAEELMERFVRGDASRSTDGSGLGLSIARSLTELQQGKFDIATDGDLFKATVTFTKETA